ncbi:MAG: DNA polymerase III subunit beta [Bacteroidales bacterium]|nr:DNA polymerase III subunit beta [Bacteroidales bacterium]
MKFVVSSSELLRGLVSVSRVIASKSSLAILDNFLFVLKDNTLIVTASDGETTLRTMMPIDQVIQEGEAAVPAKLIIDSLKEFPDQPLTFGTEGNSTMNIVWASGASKIPYFPAEDYPVLPALTESAISITIPAGTLLNGINDTIYATAEEELRPVMNGIFFDVNTDSTSLVASDAHKLVCYTVKSVNAPEKASFILHKKPASILKNILAKVTDEIAVTFDSRNAIFTLGNTVLVCRLIEGTYPAYRTVIPKNNPNKMIIGRIELLNAVRRVAVCSNQATSHIVLKLDTNELMITAEDTEFSISAYEKINCQYDGASMSIGFKAPFLAEILGNFPYENICMELADSCRAALIVSADEKDPTEDLCALLMPIMINS